MVLSKEVKQRLNSLASIKSILSLINENLNLNEIKELRIELDYLINLKQENNKSINDYLNNFGKKELINLANKNEKK